VWGSLDTTQTARVCVGGRIDSEVSLLLDSFLSLTNMLEFLMVVCLIALGLQLFIILVLKGCCCCCTRLLECIPGIQISSVGLLVPDILLAILLLVGSFEIEDDGTSDSTIATLA